MTTICECIENIRKSGSDQFMIAQEMDRRYQECDDSKLLELAEKNLRISSALCLYNRELILSLYEMNPALPPTVSISKTMSASLSISVTALTEFRFPVYRISLPFLLPNKRKKRTDFNNAVIDAVHAAVREFCDRHNIRPFKRATVFFVSYCEGEANAVDNDNKESSVILNGLSGCLLRDDHPSVCNTIYYAKESGNRPRTEVYITDSDHDIEVFARIKTI